MNDQIEGVLVCLKVRARKAGWPKSALDLKAVAVIEELQESIKRLQASDITNNTDLTNVFMFK